jgi:hypothetical protein
MPINWTKIYKKYAGLWVVLDQKETTVVSSGKTLAAALKGAKDIINPIVMNVPQKVITYVG